jgi:hypothetical protein
MLLRFFRSTSAPVILFIPFLGFLLWLPSFLSTPDSVFFFDKAPMPLYKFITDIIPAQSLMARLFTFALVVIQGFLLVRLNTRFIFINNRTYLPVLFFILITTAIPDLQRLNPVIFSGFFLVLALEKIFDSYGNNELAYDYFIAAFYLSIGALFYPFLIFFMFTIWISLALLRPFRWREWLFTLIGFALPVFFVFCFYYLVYDQPFRLVNDVKAVFEVSCHSPEYPLPVLIFLAFVMFLILLASQFMIRVYPNKKIFSRKAYTVFLWLFINVMVVFLVVNRASVELIFLGAIPVSFLLSHYFAFVKSVFWGNIFLALLFVLLLVIQTW